MVDPVTNYDFLVNIYQKSDGMDKFMALKSIGDCDTEQAMSFLKAAKNDSNHGSEIGFEKCIDLFIN